MRTFKKENSVARTVRCKEADVFHPVNCCLSLSCPLFTAKNIFQVFENGLY